MTAGRAAQLMCEMRELGARSRKPYVPPRARRGWLGEMVSIKYLDRHMSDYTEEQLRDYARRLRDKFPPGSLVFLSEGCIRVDIFGIQGEGGDDLQEARLAAGVVFPPAYGGAAASGDATLVQAGDAVFRVADGGAGGPLEPVWSPSERPVVERVQPRFARAGGSLACGGGRSSRGFVFTGGSPVVGGEAPKVSFSLERHRPFPAVS